MCNSHDDEDEKLAGDLLEMHEKPTRISRRGLLLGAGAAAALGRLGGLGSGVFTGSAAAATPATSVTGLPLTRLAMHVHGSWSEGMQSWQQACASAIAIGVDVLFLTDHNYRARAANNYITHLSGKFVATTTGSPSTHTATLSSTGVMRLMVKAPRNAPAAQIMTIEQTDNAFNHFRTGIGGQSMKVTFGNVTMGAKTMFEVVVSLSSRPATGGRPAGQYFLRYRFVAGATKKFYSKASSGLVGIVNLPSVHTGSVVTLTPEADIAALWPDIHRKDNGFFSVAFAATTAAVTNSLIDITLAGVSFIRTQNDAASVIANQRSVIAAYAAKYPQLLAILSEEISADPAAVPHCNVFGAAPKFDDMVGITASNFRDYYVAYIAAAQAMTATNTQGFITWNHPFGTSAAGSMLDPVGTRRRLFAAQLSDPVAPFLGAMGLEVGYAARGGMPFQGHLDLWDTFTRNGIWVTGTGANDEHNRSNWAALGNGFLTGVFPAANTEQAIAAGLRSGNAFTAHAGKWPGSMLSMAVDGVPMGGVSIGSATSRNVVISADNLPAGCRIQLLASPVDFTGVDPATTKVAEWTAAQLGTGGTGTVSTTVSQLAAAFYRAQVVLDSGVPIATGNPCTFLTSEPARAVPGERLVAA